MLFLQVLLYDPLYTWTLSPEKAYLLQQRRANDADTSAASTSAGDMTSEYMEIDATMKQTGT